VPFADAVIRIDTFLLVLFSESAGRQYQNRCFGLEQLDVSIDHTAEDIRTRLEQRTPWGRFDTFG
jgi:hypothetical protein